MMRDFTAERRWGATWNLKSRGSYLKVSEESSKVIGTPRVCEMHNLHVGHHHLCYTNKN